MYSYAFDFIVPIKIDCGLFYDTKMKRDNYKTSCSIKHLQENSEQAQHMLSISEKKWCFKNIEKRATFLYKKGL